MAAGTAVAGVSCRRAICQQPCPFSGCPLLRLLELLLSFKHGPLLSRAGAHEPQSRHP